jgi:hypothetical protein
MAGEILFKKKKIKKIVWNSSSQSLLAEIKTFRSSPWVANVDVVCGGQSGRWVLRRRRCLGLGLVDAVVWGLRFGIWVAPPPTMKWVWALGFGFLRRQNGFGRWVLWLLVFSGEFFRQVYS